MFGLVKGQRIIKKYDMKASKVNGIIILFSAILFSGCYYDNLKELRPQTAISQSVVCDTNGVISYSTQIVPILNASCNQNCHNPTATSGSRDLTDYAGVNAATSNGVNPYDGGSLYGTVSWNPNYGNDMPKDAPKLSDCDIVKIKKWAMAGGPNN